MGTRRLCKWDRDRIKKKAGKLRKIVEEPTHLCLKCGRAAGEPKHLCKPRALEEL